MNSVPTPSQLRPETLPPNSVPRPPYRDGDGRGARTWDGLLSERERVTERNQHGGHRASPLLEGVESLGGSGG